jgi:aminoglycoside phosphotransferase (APT) family kinase protein
VIADRLARAGLPMDRVAAHEPLSGGTYNTMHRIRLTDGTGLVLKVPPPADVPAMSYERRLLRGEADFYRAAATVSVPVPEVVHATDDFLLMTECPGLSWAEAPPPAAQRARLRRELGALTARLHAVTGTRFGYPGGAIPQAARWRDAFTAMLESLLADAERYAVRLPVPAARIRAAAEAAGPALDEVTKPTLVHFDLWDGNILVHDGRVSALIDGERMFWGDPLAELTSLNLLAGPEDDPALLAGYAEAGGRTDFDDAAHRRMALYRCYLYLIMLIEAAPRGYDADRLSWLDGHVVPLLVSAVDLLTDAAGRP